LKERYSCFSQSGWRGGRSWGGSELVCEIIGIRKVGLFLHTWFCPPHSLFMEKGGPTVRARGAPLGVAWGFGCSGVIGVFM